MRRPPLPDVRATDEADVAFLKDEAALIDSGDRIDRGRACVSDVRKSYGAKTDR